MLVKLTHCGSLKLLLFNPSTHSLVKNDTDDIFLVLNRDLLVTPHFDCGNAVLQTCITYTPLLDFTQFFNSSLFYTVNSIMQFSTFCKFFLSFLLFYLLLLVHLFGNFCNSMQLYNNVCYFLATFWFFKYFLTTFKDYFTFWHKIVLFSGYIFSVDNFFLFNKTV